MSAQPLLESLHAVYLVLMALVSLVGTTALLKLMVELVKPESHPPIHTSFETEDA